VRQEASVFGVKNYVVGQFFEIVAHKILGGEHTSNEDGDVCIYELETSVEVKSSGGESQYGWRVDVKQARRYVARSGGFPFSHTWYLFVRYSNPRERDDEGKRRSKLAKHDTYTAVHRYLAKNVTDCFLVDLSIVSRWVDSHQHSTTSILGHLGTPTIDLLCSEVAHFANGGLQEELTKLDLDPNDYGVLVGDLSVRFRSREVGRHQMRLAMTAILPTEEVQNTQQWFKWRGFDLRQRHNP